MKETGWHTLHWRACTYRGGAADTQSVLKQQPHQCDAVGCLLSHCEGTVASKAMLTQGSKLTKLGKAHWHTTPASTGAAHDATRCSCVCVRACMPVGQRVPVCRWLDKCAQIDPCREPHLHAAAETKEPAVLLCCCLHWGCYQLCCCVAVCIGFTASCWHSAPTPPAVFSRGV